MQQFKTFNPIIQNMEIQSNIYQQILQKLNDSEDIEQTLLEYIPSLKFDSGLYQIYFRLGYQPESQSFRFPLSKIQVLSEFQSKVNDTTAEDYYLIKEEFLRTFYEKGFERLSTPLDLGLIDVPLTPTFKCNPEPVYEQVEINPKGLKHLSLKVKEIICRKGLSSYKQVADELTHSEYSGRDEKNVLRRVYDALNVLIAAGVIIKTSKRYIWQSSMVNSNIISKRREALGTKREEIYQKKEQLKHLVQRFNALKELIKRNERAKDNNMIKLPFIVVSTEEHPTNLIRIESNHSNTHVRCKFSRPFRVVDESELLLNLKLHQLESHVPEKLNRLLRSDYPSLLFSPINQHF